MPKWYRLNTSGQWSPLKLYRLNTSGTWDVIKKAYRLNTSGNWDLVHTTQDVPVATTSPTLTNQSSSTTNFYGGDTLTLTRGAYTNTTANSDTTYRMTIYKGLNSSLSLNDTNWEVAARSNFTGANSTSSTSITYSLTDTDAKLGYYLVGEVRVNNDANTAGSNNYDFETASKVLSRISFSVTNLTVSPTSYGGGFSWTVSGVIDSTFIYDQTLVIRLLNSTGTIKKTVSIPAGTTEVTVSDSTNLSPSTTYYAEIQVTANDGWKTSATPNTLTSNTTFNTLSAPPVNTVAPTIVPLNNRTAPSGYIGYLPVSTTLTAEKGTWSNTNTNTTYTYNWFIEDSVTGSLQSTGFTGNTKTYSVGDVGDYIFVNAKATNSDGSFGTATSGSYILHQAVAVGTISPTSVVKDESNNFTFSISHYPTSYKINWGDNTTEYSSGDIAANTSTVNASVAHTYTSTGTYTITVTAEPGNKTNTASVTVAQSAPGPVRNLTRQLAALSDVATDKKFTWDAPNTGGSVSKYQFKINSGAWADVPGAGTQTFVELFNFNTGISNTVSIRAVGPGGNGSESSSGPFTLPIINTGPTASSISASQATISWTSSNQNAYDLPISPTVSGYVSNAGLTSTTSRTPTGLSIGTSYTATLTITSSTSDTHTKSVTFSTLSLGLTPVFGANTRTSDGFTGSVTNYDSNYTFVLTTNAGTVTPSAFSGTGTTKTFTVTGVSAGSSATVTVSTARTGYTSGSATTTESALNAALTPTFGTNTATSDGFTGSVTNYDSNYTWSLSVSPSTATVTPTSFSGSGTTKTFTVTGVASSTSSTVTVTTSRTGYLNGSASTSKTSQSSGLTPSFGAVTSSTTGFVGTVTNYDSNYTWNTPSVAAGTLTKGTWTWGSTPQTGSTRTFTVSGLSAGESSTATVTTSRTGYSNGSADVTGSALSGEAPSAPTVTGANDRFPNGGTFRWTSTGTSPISYVYTVYGPPDAYGNRSVVYSTYGTAVSGTEYAVIAPVWYIAGTYRIIIYATNDYGTSTSTTFDQYMS